METGLLQMKTLRQPLMYIYQNTVFFVGKANKKKPRMGDMR